MPKLKEGKSQTELCARAWFMKHLHSI